MAEKTNKGWINPRATFELRVSEINKLNDLIDKAEPKPIVNRPIHSETKGDIDYFYCPTCNHSIGHLYEHTNYCEKCGQKLNKDVIEF